MKKRNLFPLFIILLGVLAGCGDKQVKEVKPDTEGQKLAMPLGGDSKGTLLSFFDEDTNTFDDVETFVLDEESHDKGMVVAKADAKEEFRLKPARTEGEKCCIYFDYDSNEPRADQKAQLKAVRSEINKWQKKGYKIVFRGHACCWSPKGDSLYNMIRSNERAIHAANMLGVPESKRILIGVGYDEPMIMEQAVTKEGQAANRRVEIYPLVS
ncbi:MAG: OmpA family protein [Candidatus Babeliales bacterium]